MKHRHKKALAKEQASDKDGFRPFRDAANEMGYSHALREELVEMERRAALNLESREREELEERKSARMNQPLTNLAVSESVKYVDINAPMGSV